MEWGIMNYPKKEDFYMLETRGLTKIYKPKKGVPVKALDGVTLKFPDTGMVFLLGKSGSGKSTLLNLLGGLDKYDGGEIIIKNVSSKKFRQSHFDSYRNTYVGFIFQEYNILEEFTVGANIALALELQGKKATDAAINQILNDVDLAGYGNRRPNELSGGQKQRVAIARALVKNPKIIMADEPSGALDSATGKQVFETLKKLSETKLVIVVSHDRDFATTYGDRIIELADGRVISDTSICHDSEEVQAEGITFEGATATVPMNYRLTEEDRIAINEYLEKLQSGAEIVFADNKRANKFIETDTESIKSNDNSPFKLIKSKLRLKHAFKMGASGLKHKKFRLVMTILLSCIAFVLFGLVDTFSAYNHIQTTANSLYDSNITYASVNKLVLQKFDDYEYWESYGNKLTEEELNTLASSTDIDFSGVLTNDSNGFWFMDNLNYSYEYFGGYELTPMSLSGMVEFTQEDLGKTGYKLVAGKLPDGNKDEIAISKYIADVFVEKGYTELKKVEEYGYFEEVKDITLKNVSEMVGKTLVLQGIEYTVTGIVDTNFDITRYESLESDEVQGGASDMILDYVLYAEYESALNNNYTGMMLVGDGYIDRYLKAMGNLVPIRDVELSYTYNDVYLYAEYVATLDGVYGNNIIWLDGEKTALAENEIIISSQAAQMFPDVVVYDENGEMTIDYSALKNLSLEMYYVTYFDETYENESGYKIVGVLEVGTDKVVPIGNAVVINDSFYNEYFSNDGGIYDLALGVMPETKEGIKVLAEYCYTEKGDVKYALNNPASFELDALDEILEVLSEVFLYVGLGFVIFASILLANFIATSISYKKQEIGILRAIGSRGNDVFRIFFAEAFIIAMINFTLAALGTGAITAIINTVMRENVGLLVTVLNFGIRQILVIFAVSVAAAAIASFLPVKKIASKKPIDAIRNR